MGHNSCTLQKNKSEVYHACRYKHVKDVHHVVRKLLSERQQLQKRNATHTTHTHLAAEAEIPLHKKVFPQ